MMRACDYYTRIRDIRAKIVELKKRRYDELVSLAGKDEASPGEIDEAQKDMFLAEIDLAEAEIRCST